MTEEDEDTIEVLRYDAEGMEVKRAEVTPEGYLKVWGIAAGVGTLDYFNEDGTVRKEFVSPDALRQSTTSMIGKALTLEHPIGGKVTPDNHNMVAIGTVLDCSYNEDAQEQEVVVIITDRGGLTEIDVVGTRMLSPGYGATLLRAPEGSDYDFIQTARANNHLALTRGGRAGPEKSLRLDSAGNTIGEPMDEQKNDMKEKMDALQEKVDALQLKNDALAAQVDAFKKDAEERADMKDKDEDKKEDMSEEEKMDSMIEFYNERRKLESLAEDFGLSNLDSNLTNEDWKLAIITARFDEEFVKDRCDSVEAVNAVFETVALIGPSNGAKALSAAVRGDSNEVPEDLKLFENPWKSKFNKSNTDAQ